MGCTKATLTSQPLRFKGNKGLGSQVPSTGLLWPVSGSCWLFSLSLMGPCREGFPCKGLQNYGAKSKSATYWTDWA